MLLTAILIAAISTQVVTPEQRARALYLSELVPVSTPPAKVVAPEVPVAAPVTDSEPQQEPAPVAAPLMETENERIERLYDEDSADETATYRGIKWVTAAEALADRTKPDWWHASLDDGTCEPCMRADQIFKHPTMIAESTRWNCVRTLTFGNERPPYPTDVFTTPSGSRYKRFKDGCPVGYDVADYARRLRQAYYSVGQD